jgi:hypothetical protein
MRGRLVSESGGIRRVEGRVQHISYRSSLMMCSIYGQGFGFPRNWDELHGLLEDIELLHIPLSDALGAPQTLGSGYL